MIVARTWRAWTLTENADAYEEFIREVVFADKVAQVPLGLLGMDLLRCDGREETEFKTILWFTSLQAVEDFAGANNVQAIVNDVDRRLLCRFDEQVQHFEVPLRLMNKMDATSSSKI